MYFAIRGATYAFTSVVDTRSNSGPRGITSCDSEMCSTSGNSSSTISRVRFSWSGFTNENRYITATEVTPSCFSRCTPRRTACSSSSRTTAPVLSIRSRIGMRARRRAIGIGPGEFGSQIDSLWQRRSSISSRWPSVTSSPVFAPFISIIVLSAVVVPCTRISSWAQSSPSDSPKRSASCSKPVMTPRDWSSSVLGVLSSTISPFGVTQIRSVKVPPTSTPTR